MKRALNSILDHGATLRTVIPFMTNGVHITCAYFRDDPQSRCCPVCHANKVFVVVSDTLDQIVKRYNDPSIAYPVTDGVAIICCAVYYFCYEPQARDIVKPHVSGKFSLQRLARAVRYGTSRRSVFATSYPEFENQKGVILA